MTNNFDKTLVKFVKNSPFKVTGMSMFPMLQSGDILTFKKIRFGSLKSYDIVLVKKNSSYFVHRVVYKAKSYLITRGDNNYVSDGKIIPKQVIAKVVNIKRSGSVFNPDNLYLMQSNHYLTEIIKIKKAFDKNNIPYVFLKGLPVHLFFEKTHPKRIYSDCDILIDERYSNKVALVFKKQGYHAVDNSLLKRRATKPETSYKKIGDGVPVTFDVHQEAVFLMTQLGRMNALYPNARVRDFSKELLENRVKIQIQKEPFYILERRHLVIYLALHFFHHNFKGAFRLEFLSNIVKKGRLTKKDWSYIAETVNRYRLGNFIALPFKLMQQYYETPVPASFYNTIEYDKKTIKDVKVNVFDDDARITSGIKRFMLIFRLSPQPLWKKILVFADPDVVGHVIFSLKTKLSYFLRGFLKSR